MPASAPSYTAFDICNNPPVQSPAAYSPGMLVAIYSSVKILLFSVLAPSFLARSTLPATPIAINRPETLRELPSAKLIFSSTSSSPVSDSILFVFNLIVSGI